MTPLFELRDVSKLFTRKPDLAARLAQRLGAAKPAPVIHAVDHVSLAIAPGEVLGLVGESGCGKSTLARMALGLHTLSGGQRFWRGDDLAELAARLSAAEFRRRMLAMQMIFQDPYASLNPRQRVRELIGEAPLAHGLVTRAEADDYVAALLRQVGLDPAVMRRFPHEFSGGQRARIGIARALAVKPEFLVCDEAVAALDVSIQAQVINLFMELRATLGLTYLFISHDLGVVRHLSDRVAVMYLGRVVELAPADAIFAAPNHPYTQALLASAPRLETGKRRHVAIRGELPSPLAPPPGCHFHPRCPAAFGRCAVESPVLREIAPGRWSACHLNDG